MTTCKFCNKPISKHEVGRKTDVCIAKAMGWEKIHDNKGKDLDNAVVSKGKAGINLESRPLPHYSIDMNDAMPLWKDGWGIVKFTNLYVVRHYANWIAEAETLSFALCHAYLTEAKEK